jgi:hypothetical protein
MNLFLYIFLAGAVLLIYFVAQKFKDRFPDGKDFPEKKFTDDITYHFPREVTINVIIKKEEKNKD